MMLIFCIWVGFEKNNKLIQEFRMAYSNSLIRYPGFSIRVWSVVKGGNCPTIAGEISKSLMGAKSFRPGTDFHGH